MEVDDEVDENLDGLDDTVQEPQAKRPRHSRDSPTSTETYEVAQEVAHRVIVTALEQCEKKADRDEPSSLSSDDSRELALPADKGGLVVVKKEVELKTNPSHPLPMKMQMSNLVKYEQNGSLRDGYDQEMADNQGTARCECALIHVCPVLR
jgi:hypothetical protein